jgi:membrane-associated protease RseP (regulator of RpoE activity)
MEQPLPAAAGPTPDLRWVYELFGADFAIADVTTEALPGLAVRRGSTLAVRPASPLVVRLRGRFLTPTATAYARLAPLCRAYEYTLTFRREKGEAVIYLVPGVIHPQPENKVIPAVLAALTVLSVLFAQALFGGATELSWAGLLGSLAQGWPFTVSLLGILVAHELGHYFMARAHGVAATLPYLVPFPLSPFGTMGAVILLKDIPPSKRARLLIGVAGPIAGLVVALPVLLLGLALSEVSPLPAQGPYSMEGNSLLYAALKLLMFGRLLPAGGLDVMLHPVAFAGWAGLLVTSYNLIPAGQLDGGHIAYALLGDKARWLTLAIIAALLVMGVWWQGWLVWAVLVFVSSRREVRPHDDLSPLSSSEIALALAMLVLFALTFTPLPLRIVM